MTRHFFREYVEQSMKVSTICERTELKMAFDLFRWFWFACRTYVLRVRTVYDYRLHMNCFKLATILPLHKIVTKHRKKWDKFPL